MSKRKEVKKDIKRLIKYYRNNKGKVIRNFLFFCFFFLLAIVVVGVKIFYPFHFIISVLFLLVSVRFGVGILLFNKKKLAKSGTFKLLKKSVIAHRLIVVTILLFICLVYIFSKITPFDQNPFSNLNHKELKAYIESDLNKAVILMDNMEITGEKMLADPLLSKQHLTANERESLLREWNDFVYAMIASEQLTDIHRYFNKISYLDDFDENSKSFIIAYSLYIKKYELFHKLIDLINDNASLKKILNEYVEAFGRKKSYNDIVDRFYSTESILRKNLGVIYLKFLSLVKNPSKYGENYIILKNKAEASHTYLVKNIDSTIVNAVRSGRYGLENDMFSIWFPVQKNTASLMGKIHYSKRDEQMITVAQLQKMKEKMEPGDILMERRNWFGSNVGIPGFWPHAALYVGDINEANQYFNPVFPFDGYSSFKALVESRYVNLYKEYVQNDQNGYKEAVIEGKAPGIILFPLEVSAKADYVGVLRPRLKKEDKLKAILRAFGNFGKPYDYNFDFETRDEMVCSELVYDAYLEMEDKAGINFKLSTIAGRKVVSATDFVKKYYDERSNKNKQLDFVYFIDGNEQLKKAFVKSEREFALTWTRPKYDWSQE